MGHALLGGRGNGVSRRCVDICGLLGQGDQASSDPGYRRGSGALERLLGRDVGSPGAAGYGLRKITRHRG